MLVGSILLEDDQVDNSFHCNSSNLAFCARSDFNGRAGNIDERLWTRGVLEYWSKSIADFGMRIAELEIIALFEPC